MDQIMIGVPPSIGWIEGSYSIFEMICSKRRNFFNGCTNFSVRDALLYRDEIKFL